MVIFCLFWSHWNLKMNERLLHLWLTTYVSVTQIYLEKPPPHPLPHPQFTVRVNHRSPDITEYSPVPLLHCYYRLPALSVIFFLFRAVEWANIYWCTYLLIALLGTKNSRLHYYNNCKELIPFTHLFDSSYRYSISKLKDTEFLKTLSFVAEKKLW